MTDEWKGPKKTILSRGAEFTKLFASLAISEAKQRIGSASVLVHRTQQARQLVESLGQLKGAAMKVGQWLSIEAQDFFPEEIVVALSKLQDSTQAMSFDEVRRILKAELGEKRYSEFTSLEETPVASASIGQVHRGTWHGRDVALKVQFPGISNTIDSDLKMLQRIISGFSVLIGRGEIDFSGLFDELGTVLKQETDYLQESQNLTRYRELLKSQPMFVLPEVIPELTTKQVLGMTYEEGLRFQELLDQVNSKDPVLEFYAKALLDLYFVEFFEWGFVQTDPNFGNYLFRPETKKIVLLDFGAVKTYEREFVDSYRKLLRLIREGEDQPARELAVRIKLLDVRESDACWNACFNMIDRSLDPFESDVQPFDFTQKDYTDQVRKSLFELQSKIRFSPPPRALIFLHRKLGGIFNLLRRMNVKLDLSPYWQKVTK